MKKTKKVLDKIKNLPGKLQKFMLAAIEPDNWDRSTCEICKKIGLNYTTIRIYIWEYGARDFWKLRSELVKETLEEEMPKIYRALIKKAQKGDPQALKLALQWRGELVEKKEVEQTGEVVVRIVRETPSGE